MLPVSLPRARWTLIVMPAILALGACGGNEVPLAEQAVVTTPVDTLTAEGLRDILLRAPALPAEGAAIGAVSIWTDLAVVVAAVTGGATLDDDATLATVMRPVIMERTIQRYADGRTATVTPTAAQMDSIVRGNTVRVFRRYMIGPIDARDTAAVIAASRRLFRLREQASADGSPAAALRTLGDEAAGIEVSPMQANSRQELPEQLARTIWPLNERDLSEPVLGAGGVQLFERVPAAEAREAITAWLGPVLQRRADAVFIDSIMASRNLAVAEDGAARLRAAAVEPGRFASDAPLATWSGGDLSTEEARGWLAIMPAPERARMRLASDTTLTQTVDLMARREILYELAIAAGTDPSLAREELLPDFRGQLQALAADARAAGDPTVWMNDVLAGRRTFRPQPGSLPALLRDRMEVTVDDEAMTAGLREAARLWQAPGSRAP